MARLLFLSHAGIDTEAAAALKARILAAPSARAHGLDVWFDKDDLRAGEPWQRQLEDAIGRSHAFAVYVGSRGVVNWVDAEVRLALNRAITEPDYRFVPVLAGAAPGAEALPGFARQFQGVWDVETRPDQFDNLMRAVLGGAEAGQLQLETEPFFGLRAIDESRSHLFFGRERETEALTLLVRRTPLVLVTGDSGSGKSSLVRAGLVPRFRGGALALLEGARPQDTVWHVVTTRPRNQPFRQLGEAVDEAAKGLGRALADRGTLADWAASGEIDKVRRALRCDLPPERVELLLVVDQFEELLTITPAELRGPFIDLLLDLADPAAGRHRVVLTMRHDYANLCNAYERLKQRLDADDRRARFLLGRMSDEGLCRIVTEPLRLAAVEAAERTALAGEVLRDVGERPGDLALVQMALTETWRARDRHGGDLLRAYAAVGRVEGALAQAAERVRTAVLDAEGRALLDGILLRLVRLGDTGGATRRLAARAEFDDARWPLVQKLASEDGRRLVLLRGGTDHPTVEIAHEALVTAWPYFQNLLQETADDKRILDTLIPRAQAWAADEDHRARDQRLATGADLALFAALAERRAAWLAPRERAYLLASRNADLRRQRLARLAVAALVLLTIVAVVAGAVAWGQKGEADAQAAAAEIQRQRAEEQAALAETRQKEAEEQTQITERERARAEQRAVEAETALAWSTLEFANGGMSVNDARGLWWIATATPAAKRQSHAYLREDGHFAEVYARRPLEVIRALSLAPTDELIQTLLRMLASRKPAVRRQTARALATLGATDQTPAIAGLLADRDDDVRLAAIEALVKLGANDQAAAIAKLLDDGADDVRQAAVGALGTLGASDQAPPIAARLADDDASVSLAAVKALGMLGATDQAATIAGLLTNRYYDFHQTVVDALRTLRTTDQTPAIAARLADEAPEVRRAAIEALATLGATDQVTAVAARLADQDPEVRQAAAEAVATLGATEQVTAIAARLTDEEPNVREAAIEALGTLGATEQVTAIATRLADEDTDVRQAAVEALGRLGGAAHAAAIAALLADRDYDLRQAVVETLARFRATDQALTIAALLADRDATVRQGALEALGRTGATDQKAAIVVRLADEESFVRRAAAEALGRLGATDQAATIAAHVVDEPNVSEAAVEALKSLGVTDQGPTIAAFLTDGRFGAREAAVEALGRLGATDQVPAIAARLADEEPDVRLAAVEALASLGATDHVTAIAERLTDGGSGVRQAAAEALATLGATDQAPAIAALLTDDLGYVRLTAVEALGSLGATDQAAAIAAHLADEDADVRRAAAKALATLVARDGTLAHALCAASRHQLLAFPASADSVPAAVVGISEAMAPAQAVAEMVEALKHPLLGGEDATRVLLAGLEARFAAAPGPERGLYPNLAWIAAEFPDIDLGSPPKNEEASRLPLLEER